MNEEIQNLIDWVEENKIESGKTKKDNGWEPYFMIYADDVVKKSKELAS